MLLILSLFFSVYLKAFAEEPATVAVPTDSPAEIVTTPPATTPSIPAGSLPVLPPSPPIRIGSDGGALPATQDKTPSNSRPKLEGDVLYYDEVYGNVPKTQPRPVKLPYEGTVGNFNSKTVELFLIGEHDGERLRIPRVLFSRKADVRPGSKLKIDLTLQDFEKFKVK